MIFLLLFKAGCSWSRWSFVFTIRLTSCGLTTIHMSITLPLPHFAGTSQWNREGSWPFGSLQWLARLLSSRWFLICMVIRLIFSSESGPSPSFLTHTTNLEYFSQHAIDKYWPVFQSQFYFEYFFFGLAMAPLLPNTLLSPALLHWYQQTESSRRTINSFSMPWLDGGMFFSKDDSFQGVECHLFFSGSGSLLCRTHLVVPKEAGSESSYVTPHFLRNGALCYYITLTIIHRPNTQRNFHSTTLDH